MGGGGGGVGSRQSDRPIGPSAASCWWRPEENTVPKGYNMSHNNIQEELAGASCELRVEPACSVH